MIILTLEEQVEAVKSIIVDKYLKKALLQSLEVLTSNADHNDSSIIVRLPKDKAILFNKFTEHEHTRAKQSESEVRANATPLGTIRQNQQPAPVHPEPSHSDRMDDSVPGENSG